MPGLCADGERLHLLITKEEGAKHMCQFGGERNTQPDTTHLVWKDDEKCVGCNRCIRVCPVETANIAYQDAQGNTKVTLDASQCVLCGACVQCASMMPGILATIPSAFSGT